MCRTRCKAPFHPSCAAQSCRSPTSAEDVGGNNPAAWNQNHRNGSGRARKCSLTGSHRRLDFPSSMQVLKHDVSEWYAACESFLCSCLQAGVGREGKPPPKHQESGGTTLLPPEAQLKTRSQQHPQMPKSNSKADMHDLPPQCSPASHYF